ncbi:lysozyme [Synechococcus phage S-CREM2]|nr:lysozyme [Synechococcus phage S-CREM2]
MKGLITTALLVGVVSYSPAVKSEPLFHGPLISGALCKSDIEPEPVEFHQHVRPLADLISQGEGDWNSVNRGWAGDTPGGIQRLTGKTFEMYTVGQVLDMQRGWIYAVGRYQFIPKTLRYAVRVSDVSYGDKFNSDTQDKLFAALLNHKRPAVGSYIRGEHGNKNWALNELAREWASVEYSYGRGYYDGYGGNRAKISRYRAGIVLDELRATYK